MAYGLSDDATVERIRTAKDAGSVDASEEQTTTEGSWSLLAKTSHQDL